MTKLWLTPRTPRYPRPRMPVRHPSPPLQPQRLRSRARVPEPHLLALRATPPGPGCALRYRVASSELSALRTQVQGDTRKCANPFWVPRSCMFRYDFAEGRLVLHLLPFRWPRSTANTRANEKEHKPRRHQKGERGCQGGHGHTPKQ